MSLSFNWGNVSVCMHGYPLVSNKIENLLNELHTRRVTVTFFCFTLMNRMCEEHLISLRERVA